LSTAGFPTTELSWDEWGTSFNCSDNDIVGVWFHDDGPIIYILEIPIVNEPRTRSTHGDGQHSMVLSGLKTVVVLTGGNYVSSRTPFKIHSKYYIPATGIR
jgi:hypothetical protein